MPAWMQMLFCVPVWIISAMIASAWKASRQSEPEKRTLWWRWCAVSGFVLLTSLLWANPSQMLSVSGPFSGRVIDADTGEPVTVAVVSYHWGGHRGSYHHASVVTDADGRYRVSWQGFANWRIGASPSADAMTIQSPGYATARFFLDGVFRAPDGGYYDENAKSATIRLGVVRLQRLRSGTRYNQVRYAIPFGIGSRTEHRRVAERFYDVLFPRLCAEPGKTAEWEPTDAAFMQLGSIVGVLPTEAFPPRDTGWSVDYVSNDAPKRLDDATVERRCRQLTRIPTEGTRP